MHKTQQYYKILTAALLVSLLAVPASGAPARTEIANPDTPQPLLHDGSKGPCDPRLDGPNYVPGVDVSGNPVPSAGQAGARNPVPDGVLVPLRSRGRSTRSGAGPVVAIDGKALEPILNPAPACSPER